LGIFFIDGFDKYGSAVQVPGAALAGFAYSRLAANMAGEYNAFGSADSFWIDRPLSATGYSIGFTQSNITAGTLTKVFPSNIARIGGGFRFKLTSLTGCQDMGITFIEGANVQARVVWENATGKMLMINSAGATIGTSVAAITANTTHYLEFDITFADSGAYTLYLDGVSILTGTADFKAGSNAYATGCKIGSVNGNLNAAAVMFVDDFYLDDAGSVLLTSPSVETTLMSSDSATAQFSTGNAIFGDWEMLIASTNAPGANQLFLRKFTPSVSGSLASVSCNPQATSAGAKFKAVVYADSAGSPTGSSLATGTEVVGTGTAAFNNNVTSTFSSPPSLTGGTPYWIGFITDTSVVLTVTNSNTTSGAKAANTYGSGPPTNPSMTTGQSNWALWGTLTGVTSHTYAVSQAPNSPGMGGDFSYVTDSTVGHEDLLNVAGLVANPATIYAVAVKGIFRDSDAGARTVTLRTKSSSTDSGSAAFSPGTTYQWFSGYWPTDPNGSIAWTKTNLNNALAGYKIAT
jgi:hypothetical protein